MAKSLFTSESVTEGHPDKICDQISDAILDAILEKDQMARVACETMVSTGLVFVTGEITTNCYVDIPKICRETIMNIGYDRAKYGFDGATCSVLTAINEQSPDIAMGVDTSMEGKQNQVADMSMQQKLNQVTDTQQKQVGSKETGDFDSSRCEDSNNLGAGDQGMMFGFACDETPEYMPMPIHLANQLSMQLTKVRKEKKLAYLRPDGKTQVTVEYENGLPSRVHTVLVSAQHSPEISHEQIHQDILRDVIHAVIPEQYLDDRTRILVNPTGRFVIGGPQGDTGLTGRKIIVDTYGGYARHGGGAFSGKDATKVDRSACYAARYVAKNLVAAGLAKQCEIQLSYAIGVAQPLSIKVETFKTSQLLEEQLVALVNEHFDLTPSGIIQMLDLRRPIYQKTAAYGHFGRTENGFTWEKTDRVESLKMAAKRFL